MEKTDIRSKLVQIGLNEDEAQVYMSLIETGETSAGPVIKTTGLHRQIVYTTLERLEKRGLVHVTTKKGIKHWISAYPEVIREEIDRKDRIASEVIPALLNMRALSHHGQEVRIYEGPEDFAAMQVEGLARIPEGSIYRVVGSGPILFTETMASVGRLEEFESRRIERKILIQLIFSESEREARTKVYNKYFKDQPEEFQRKYRFLPEERNSPVGIHIWNDTVVLVLYGSQLLTIEIKSKSLTEDFLQYFKHLWELAND